MEKGLRTAERRFSNLWQCYYASIALLRANGTDACVANSRPMMKMLKECLIGKDHLSVDTSYGLGRLQ